MSLKLRIAPLFFLPWVQLSAQYVINTFAGGGAPQGLPAVSVGVGTPTSITKDLAGNIYIASGEQNRVYKVDVNGIITTVAGNGEYGYSGDGGPAISAVLGGPGGIAVDQSGSIYIADSGNNRIRKVTNGIITTVVGNGNAAFAGDGGPALNAALNVPTAVALDGSGNLYISDGYNGRVRKVSGGIISSVAGGGGASPGDGGLATNAIIGFPSDVAFDSSGNLYIAESTANRVQMVTNGVITTVAGNGTRDWSGDSGSAINASLNQPGGIALDSSGTLYISQQWDGRVRKVLKGIITTVAGNGTPAFSGDNGPATSAGLGAAGLFSDPSVLYIADGANSRIRTVVSGVIHTIVGNGSLSYMGDGVAATATTLAGPTGVAVDNTGNVYIADTGNSRIRKVSGRQMTTVASLTECPISNRCSYQLTVDPTGSVYFTDLNFIRKISKGVITVVAGNGSFTSSGDGGLATSAGVTPDDVLTVAANGDLYFSEFRSKVRRVSSGIITTVAGSNNFALGDGGPALSAGLLDISGLAVDSAGNLFITDTGHRRIREVTNGVITTIGGTGTAGSSGDGGPAGMASISPFGLTLDSSGNLYFWNSFNIRMISNGIITTIASIPPTPVNIDSSLARDTSGNLYAADWWSNRIWILSPTGLGSPIGSFDTPLDNTTGVAGAIPVTGWALDNVGISKVQVWREPVGNEPVASNHLVYVGDAVQVAGVRPDVQALYPNMPFNDRAGWGYMLLTNFLPSVSGALGNGTYKLHFIAYNNAGGQTDLGTRTIVVDNVHASKPFGTIDTPGQGDTIEGNAYVNFGWALTQNPYCIPNDGHTLNVFIDGVILGHPTYNQKRSDIATLFPGLCNSNGGVGFFYIDTTKLANGLHNIAWAVTDNQGRGDGIGSRYFTVQNAGGVAAPDEMAPESVKTRTAQTRRGSYAIEVEELDRIELDLGTISSDSLPVGSTLKDGVFYWQLGPGFLGDYEFRFTRADGTRALLHVKVRPKSYARN